MADRAGDGWDGVLRGAGATGFTARLDRWVADARADEAALTRSRERWLQQVAEQEATVVGVLADLAERHAGISIEVGGRRHHGTVVALGADFVAMRVGAGADVLLAMRAVGVIRTAPTVNSALGDRVITTELRLADVLAELAADRERVRLVGASGGAVTGELRSVGQDVVVVRTDGDPAGSAYVPLATLVEVAVGV